TLSIPTMSRCSFDIFTPRTIFGRRHDMATHAGDKNLHNGCFHAVEFRGHGRWRTKAITLDVLVRNERRMKRWQVAQCCKIGVVLASCIASPGRLSVMIA
ncbi:MAG: hypothetical protein M3Y22_08645, partial [Pseudomonadota bacterium]|nr:hypothetical protein [Pseudomonadota bacterium]